MQSGSFALTQQSLADAQADGEAFAAKAGCPDQTADCLRRLPVADLVRNFPGAAIPGVVDGAVLEESLGTALAAGRFARVPILNGINHEEQQGFVTAAEAVNAGAYVPVPEPVTPESYQHVIASVLSVPAARAAAIAAEYPLSADAPLQGSLSPDQQALATSMRTAWANFAASGNPASTAVPWPAFGADSTQMLSLVAPRPQVETDFASRHHCAFWAAG